MSETNQLVWREAAGDFRPGVKTEVCKFDYNGRRYHAYRDTTGTMLALCKRERSNGMGFYYQRLNLGGAVARKVIKAVFTASPAPSPTPEQQS